MGRTRRAGGLVTRARRRIANAVRPNVEVVPVAAGIRAEWDVPVVARDGTTLRVNVFRPPTDELVPVIMSAHPYGKDAIPARTRSGHGVNPQYRIFPQPHRVRFSSWTSWEAPDPAVWAPRGFAVVNADLRGGGTSEGTGELFSDQEAEDYYDLIEWAGIQPWSMGRVALDGVSYLAISQYKVAALRPPHLAAICAWEGFSDLYRDFARPGGVREDGFSIIWSALTRRAARIATNVRTQIVTRPERDAWYASVTPDLERIDVPMLVCGSFSDHCLHSRGSFEAFRRAGSPRKWLYTHRDGKWCHYYSQEATETRARFFEYVLKGLDTGWPHEPAVRLAIHEAGPEPVEVTHEDQWPPADLEWTALALDLERGLLVSGEAPSRRGSASFSTRRGRLSLTWVVPEDLDIIGPMSLRLHVAVRHADDVHLFAGVRKIREGVECNFEGSFGFAHDMVSTGWQRAAHRELDAALSTREQPVHTHARAEPLKPGEIVPVEIALLPHATRFRRGDRLRLDIRGSWHYPRDPVRGQLPSGYQGSPKGTCVVFSGGPCDSHLYLGIRPLRPRPAPE
jgi:hypothetical protein